MKYCYLLLLLLPWLSAAQSASTVWYPGGGSVLDFSIAPVRVTTAGSIPALTGATTHTDASGRVRLIVTASGLYGPTGQLLPNGQFTDPVIAPERTLIVAQPGSGGSRCYVFYVVPDRSNTRFYTGVQLSYSLVDLVANGGAGAVVSKDQVLRPNIHGYFGVATQCDANSFWLVTEVNQNGMSSPATDIVEAHRFTAAGLAGYPVVSQPALMGHSSGYKFSPAGDQVVFNCGGYFALAPTLGLARFNPATGVMSRAVKLADAGWEAEFSPSGRMLYVVKRDSVVQFDVSSRDSTLVRASRTVLRAGMGLYRSAQLAPDGRIYLDSINASRRLAVIRFPEQSGAAAAFTPGALVLPRPVSFLPRSPANALFVPPVRPDAGPDRLVCEGQPVALGGGPAVSLPLTWSPATYLSAANTATPVFQYTGPALTDTLRLSYTLTVDDGNCSRQDVVRVTVLPRPPAPVIVGSQSVCPGVVGVEYRVPPHPGQTYAWTVTGGTVTSGQGTDTVQVTWGPTTATARVQVVVLNTLGCPGPSAVLPVRINPVLQPPTPQGPVRVCFNQRQSVGYEVMSTTGSVYTWTAQGGRIVTGQGSSRVTVDWAGLGAATLRLEERSTTRDTVCFGVSATLAVVVFQDSTRGQFTAASIGPGSDAASTLTWAFNQPLAPARPLQLLRRVAGAATWQPVATLPSTARTYQDQGLDADQNSYEYLLRTSNACAEPLETLLHRTVRLTVLPAVAAGTISLAWNAYAGWPTGPTGYELWRRLDGETEFSRLRQLSSTLQLADVESRAGSVHQYRIRALGPGSSAWSNTVDLAFEHPLIIPSVFTPNGDGQNDTFMIPDLAKLYSDNSIVIFSRWGQKVYEQQHYKGDWSGSTVSAGPYFYLLHIPSLNTSFKGWVEVVK
jgi:gliding motility-associated-like protein